MGLLNWLKSRFAHQPEVANQESRKLAAFALEVAPFEYHFSTSPDRSITFGYKGNGGERGATYLMAPNDSRVPDIMKVVERLIERHRLLATPMTNPDLVFKNREEPSVHIQIMLAVGAGWKSCFTAGNVPSNVQAFVDATRTLESRFTPLGPVSTDERIAKIIVTRESIIYLDGQQVTLERLDAEIARRLPEVWYHREHPDDKNPHENAMKVLDIIIKHRRPVALYLDSNFTTRAKLQ
jgi:hypothetical protein